MEHEFPRCPEDAALQSQPLSGKLHNSERIFKAHTDFQRGNNPTYQVFRNVLDYGAVGDGVTVSPMGTKLTVSAVMQFILMLIIVQLLRITPKQSRAQ